MPTNVLVVEDTESYREMLAKTLGDEGYEVESVIDGYIALERIRDGEFDAVVSDVVLPRMSGFSLLEEVRQFDARLPFILTSTWDTQCARDQATGLGANAFVSKDILMDDLLGALRGALAAAVNTSVSAPLPRPAKVVIQRRLHFTNEPRKVFEQFCDQAREVLLPLPACDRVQLAQAAATAIRAAIYFGNLELDDDFAVESALDRLAVRRAAEAPYDQRQVHVLLVLDSDRFRLGVVDQGPGFDYRPLLFTHLASAIQTFGDIRFQREGHSFDLINRRRPGASER